MEALTLHSALETLLIVDDEPLMTDLFQQFMTKRGFQVLSAATGQEALATVAAQGEIIKLVMLDLTLPDMSGIEVARRLAESAPALPVVIASGHDLDPFLALPSNIVEVVKKPYRPRVLAGRIREIINASRAGSRA